MCTLTWISWVITTDGSTIRPGEVYKNKMPKAQNLTGKPSGFYDGGRRAL